MVEESKLPPEPWQIKQAPLCHRWDLTDAEGILIADDICEAAAELFLNAPATARRLEKIERAASVLVAHCDAGDPHALGITRRHYLDALDMLRTALEDEG